MKRILSILALVVCVSTSMFAQQVFTLEGIVDPEITDSCYNIYLADENFHIQDDVPVACVPVIDKKFHYELPLDKMTSGRIRCIFPGGELCSAWIDLFFVPGETATLHVHNGYYDLEQSYNYKAKVSRGVWTARNATNWQSPNLPKIKGKAWNDPKQESRFHPYLYVKDVFLNDTETVLHLVSDMHMQNMIIGSKSLLVDENGNEYKFVRSLMGEVDENTGQEVRVYGGYYAFEPLPKDVKAFSFYNSNGFLIDSISPAPKQKKHKPNFNLNITASEGIGDSGYLLMMYDEDETYNTQIADFPTDKNRKASYSMYMEKPRLVDVFATFPDGSVCTHCMRFPFVPNEKAELKVMNGSFYLSGTGFYKQWGMADELVENASKYKTAEETKAMVTDYLKAHANEEGCVSYYVMYKVLPLETLVSMLPESMLSTEFGKKIKLKAERER